MYLGSTTDECGFVATTTEMEGWIDGHQTSDGKSCTTGNDLRDLPKNIFNNGENLDQCSKTYSKIYFPEH